MPSMPAAAMVPQAKRLSYARLRISGRLMRVNTAQATMLEPVQAPNRALAQVVAMARPPGSRPTHLYVASKARLLIPAWVANRPMMMNRGRTVKANEAVVAYGVVVSSPRPNLMLPVMPMMPTKPTTASDKPT